LNRGRGGIIADARRLGGPLPTITTKMKLLVNSYEAITHDRLVAACGTDDARVCPKVRVKDALPIEGSGVSHEQFTFALQSHFDFVVTDKDWNTLFAVEFDGSSHALPDGRRRDGIKNGLCERFKLPLLRVKANHLQRRFRQWDLLSYFVETWFLKRAFEVAQENGTVPLEEDFDPMMIISDGNGKRWPYWFSAKSQLSIKKLHEAGKIAHFAPSHVIGLDSMGNYHCLAFLKISADEWAVIQTGMRSQLFDVCTSDVVWQVAIVELCEKLDQILARRVAPYRFSQVDALVQQFQSSYPVCSSGGIVEAPMRSAAHNTD
jgi:hypothetical protein